MQRRVGSDEISHRDKNFLLPQRYSVNISHSLRTIMKLQLFESRLHSRLERMRMCGEIPSG